MFKSNRLYLLLMVVPLVVGRSRSLSALEKASMESERLLLLSTQKMPEEKEPGPDRIHEVGILAKIHSLNLKIITVTRIPAGTPMKAN